MDIRQLSYFVEVARQQGFSRAGQVLHITQPSISKMVKNLEEELGVVLLDRSTKYVSLTDAGEVVFKQSQKILASFDNLSTELADVMNIHRGTIHVGLPPMVGANFFPRILAEFYSRYPQITIKLIENGARKIEKDVEEGYLDMGAAVLPINEEMFDYYSFIKENLMLLVHPGYFLARKEEITLAELKDESFVFYRKDFTLHYRIKEECKKAGYIPRIVYESSQWDFITAMVAANLGVALLPYTICKALNPARVKAIPLVKPVIPWHLGMIWRKDRYLSFATREFLDFTRKMLIR